MLEADAGYGKTTALEQALERREGGVAWVRCSEADADPGRLLERLMTALAVAVPGVADPLRERIVNVGDPVVLSAVSAELRADLERLLIEPVVVVFDDAEHLAEAPGAAAIVADLLAVRAPQVTVAVATRRRLPMDLSRLRVEERVTELGPDDLAFTPDECAACLDARRGSGPHAEEVQRLVAQTRGWPLGVALAGGAAPGGEFVPEARRTLFDYFDEQVLSSLDRELRTAAIEASVAPRLDRSLVESLGIPVLALDRMGERGLFVGAEDGRWGPTAYHPLFREFLLERLAHEVPANRRRELWARLAGALGSRGPRSGRPGCLA